MRHYLEPGYVYNVNNWRIIDGDTVVVSVSGEPDPNPKHHVRLAGINAPEAGAPGGSEATYALYGIFQRATGMSIYVTPTTDTYGRAVGILSESYADYSVNELLVRQGLATASFVTQYADYRTAQSLAQQEGIGIWQTTASPDYYSPDPQGPRPDGDLLRILDWACSHKLAAGGMLLFLLLVIWVGFCN